MEEGYEITFTPQEIEEMEVIESMRKFHYYKINAKIFKVLYKRYPKIIIEGKSLLYWSVHLFNAVDKFEKLKFGTSMGRQYFMTYEKKIADIIKDNKKAIYDLIGGKVSLKNLTFNQIKELQKLGYYSNDEVKEYEESLADNYDGTPSYYDDSDSDSDPDEDDHFEDYMRRKLNI